MQTEYTQNRQSSVRRRPQERGIAILFVLILAAALFSLLAVAVGAVLNWQSMDKKNAAANREAAAMIQVVPD